VLKYIYSKSQLILLLRIKISFRGKKIRITLILIVNLESILKVVLLVYIVKCGLNTIGITCDLSVYSHIKNPDDTSYTMADRIT